MAACWRGLVLPTESPSVAPLPLPPRAACRVAATSSLLLSALRPREECNRRRSAGVTRSRHHGSGCGGEEGIFPSPKSPLLLPRPIGVRWWRQKGPVASPSAMGEKMMWNAEGDQVATGRSETRSRKEVLAAAALTVALATGNRVFYKLALIPLKNYPFFLAQLATFGYVVVYFSILYFRYHAGIVTDKMLSLPKGPYVAIGLLETISAVSGMAATAVLSGASIPILSQTFLVWQLILSYLVLGRRYRFNQVVGCLLVSVGVIITVMSGTGSSVSLRGTEIFWTLLMINSFLFQAADTVLKEIIFENATKNLKGGSVDIFVVNSYGSAFQALFTCLLLPLLTKLWGIPLAQLPAYIKDGTACFLNIGSLSHGCEGAPLLPVLFVLVNMAFNISLLNLVKISSGVASCLASTFSVPLSIYVFTLPLPYAGVPSPLPAGFLAGAAVLVAGLLLYSFTPPPPGDQSTAAPLLPHAPAA